MINTVKYWTDENGENWYFVIFFSGRTFLRNGENRLPKTVKKFIAEHKAVRFYNPYLKQWEKICSVRAI